jgi:DNA transformation protein
MAVSAQFLEYVLEQLSGLGAVRARRMFSGVGLYSGGLFFGLVHDDTLFFKTGAANAQAYAARNMPRFLPPAKRPMSPMGYHQVPADIVEDAEALATWGRDAIAVALASRVVKERAGKPGTRKRKARTRARR